MRHAPCRDVLVALDSDGTVFPNMPAKFLVVRDTILKHWNLEPVRREAEEVIRFVNLESAWRGSHRFPALLKMMDLLRSRFPKSADMEWPDLNPLRRFVDSGAPLSNARLAAERDRTGEAVLEQVRVWSEDLSRCLQHATEGLGPMAGAREALTRMRGCADAAVVSQAPGEQLEREWSEHGIASQVFAIAGSEYGRKPEQIRMLAGGRYAPDRLLMVGDAPGDRDAAAETGACFFPILPGQEEFSWSLFLREALDLFLAGRYRGSYEHARVREFVAILPERPPWERA